MSDTLIVDERDISAPVNWVKTQRANLPIAAVRRRLTTAKHAFPASLTSTYPGTRRAQAMMQNDSIRFPADLRGCGLSQVVRQPVGTDGGSGKQIRFFVFGIV